MENTKTMLRGQDAIDAANKLGVQLYRLDADARWVPVDVANVAGPAAPYGVRTAEVLAALPRLLTVRV